MHRFRRMVILLLMAPALLSGAIACSQRAPEERTYPYDVNYDFRGKPLPKEMHVLSSELVHFVHSEPEGLRITLPKDRTELQPLVLGTRFGLEGDFEITVTLEILDAEPPPTGYGAGATFFINKQDKPGAGATIGRLLRPNGKDILLVDHVFGKGHNPPHEAVESLSTDKRLRMRFKRTGAKLSYHVAPGLQDTKFEELWATNFGTDDIRQVIMIVTTGKQPAGIDVRWIDLRIRSAGVHGPMPPMPTEPSRLWLVTALLAAFGVLVVLLVSIAAALFLQRRWQQLDVVAAGFTLFDCPHCGKRLKAKTELAGKNVKCPKCGTAAPVRLHAQ